METRRQRLDRTSSTQAQIRAPERPQARALEVLEHVALGQHSDPFADVIGRANVISLAGVAHSQYNVHRYFFARDSAHFRAILQGAVQRTAAIEPCVLSGVNCTDFHEFLAILYPTYANILLAHAYTNIPISDFRQPAKKTTAQWISVLHLAAEWDFTNIKLLAIDHLTENATPIDKIVLGRRYSITDWLPGAYEAVCTRADPLNLEEGMKLGVEDTVRISAARQMYGTCQARYETKCLSADLGDIFNLENSAEGNSLSMGGEETLIDILEGQTMEARVEHLATPTPPADSGTKTAQTHNPEYYRGCVDVPRRGSIPEHLPIGTMAGNSETLPTACPALLLPDNIPPPLSSFGTTSPNIEDTFGGRQELTVISLKVKSEPIAAVTSIFDPSATHLHTNTSDLSAAHLPMSTALENLVRHESRPSSARSPIREELTCENGPQIAIGPVDIESQPVL
ncbi:hypothetical protein FIBSPDRAFT_1050506 [Athelia psychrophila]|uniref:BTB domain-containing protein n=1 Tax=Athelia psychrophila TaxID=1759441 RepID=A0A166AR25_9AGAM|nr:hypothetical protein FIBSPDRAFT_1050506 [Fibularhizoctonia sp. CBS 109695]